MNSDLTSPQSVSWVALCLRRSRSPDLAPAQMGASRGFDVSWAVGTTGAPVVDGVVGEGGTFGAGGTGGGGVVSGVADEFGGVVKRAPTLPGGDTSLSSVAWRGQTVASIASGTDRNRRRRIA